jgi:pilus assembly protein Flp/PilA
VDVVAIAQTVARNREHDARREDARETRAMKSIINFVRNEQGQDLIEYALLAGLVALAATVAMTNVGSAISNKFEDVATELNGAVAP